MAGDDIDQIEEHLHTGRSMKRCHDYQNDTVLAQPVVETTAKRHRPLSPIGDESLSRRPPPVLPDDLIVEILLRLPVRCLLQLRCVSKSWKTLISDPQFAKNHLRRSTEDLTMTHQRLVSSIITQHCKIVSYPVKSLFEYPLTPSKAVSTMMRRKYHILGSCNGLLCLYDIHQGCVRLWNPCTRLKSKRSPIVVRPDGIITYHGFGYDQVNDKYKLLVVVEDLNETVTKVYTFGSISWITIQNFPCAPTRWSGKFVSGTLNWVAKGGVSSDQWVILSFDLEKETYGEVLLPEQDGVSLRNPVLDVLSNCLCVCFDSNKTHWAVWLMKKYGVAESWTKLMMIPHEKFRVSTWTPPLEPLCLSENGVLLVRTMYSILVLYDSNNGSLDYTRIWSKRGLDLHVYHESLVSPPC